jgi:hypothetical protein
VQNSAFDGAAQVNVRTLGRLLRGRSHYVELLKVRRLTEIVKWRGGVERELLSWLPNLRFTKRSEAWQVRNLGTTVDSWFSDQLEHERLHAEGDLPFKCLRGWPYQDLQIYG